jgi:O-antigen/teichoic acid export membrane protein
MQAHTNATDGGEMAHSRVLRDVLLQAGGKYAALIIQVVRGVVIAGILSPLGLGTVATVMLVLGYAMYSDLGVGDATMRELPLAIGAGDERRRLAWRWYAVSAKVTGALVMAAGIAVYLILRWSETSVDLRFGLTTAIVVVVLQQLVIAEGVVLQAEHLFARVALVNIALPASSLVFGVAGALLAGVRGVFVGQLVAYGLAALLAAYLGGRIRRRPLPELGLRRLLAIGLPFMALSFAFYNLIYIDQIMVVSLLGRAALGVYTIALYAGTALYMLPAALASAVGPRLLRRYGELGTADSIRDLTWRPVQLLSVSLPPLIAAAWFFGPLLIHIVLPDYSGAVGPLRIYATGIFFLGLNLGVSTALFAFNQHRRNIPVIAGAIALNVLLDLLFVNVLHLGLSGIALGSLVTYTAYWIAQTTLVTRAFGASAVDGLLQLLGYGWPGLVMVAILAAAAATDLLADPALLAFAGVLALICVLSGVRLVRKGMLVDIRELLRRQTP